MSTRIPPPPGSPSSELAVPRIGLATKSKRGSPRWARAALGLVLAAGTLTIAGCDEAQKALDRLDSSLISIDDYANEQISKCTDQSCVDYWKNWAAEQHTLSEAVRRSIIQEDFQHARQQNDEWQKTIRQTVPTWPDIKDLIPYHKDTPTTPDVTGKPVQPAGGGSTQQGAPVVPAAYLITGTVALEDPVYPASLRVAGSFRISGQFTSDGGLNASITGGSLNVTELNTGEVITLAIDPDVRNRITIDGAGSGRIEFVSITSVTNEMWDLVLPRYLRLSFPVVRQSNGTLRLVADHARLGDLMPFTPYYVTDYDRNGVRDHAPDLAAYLTGRAAHEERADVNADGVWNQADIDQWESMFLDDSQ